MPNNNLQRDKEGEMVRYRRSNVTGGTCFITVNLAARDEVILVRHIEDLRKVMTQAKEAHPFSVVVMVVLPEHLHAIWRLPAGDADHPTRSLWGYVLTSGKS